MFVVCQYSVSCVQLEANERMHAHAPMFVHITEEFNYQHPFTALTDIPQSNEATMHSAAAEAQKGLYLRSYPYRRYNKLKLVSF